MSMKPVEIGILALSTSKGVEWTGEEQKIAHRLVKRGFLSNDVSDPSVFRSTSEGVQALQKLLSAHG